MHAMHVGLDHAVLKPLETGLALLSLLSKLKFEPPLP